MYKLYILYTGNIFSCQVVVVIPQMVKETPMSRNLEIIVAEEGELAGKETLS